LYIEAVRVLIETVKELVEAVRVLVQDIKVFVAVRLLVDRCQDRESAGEAYRMSTETVLVQVLIKVKDP
jgi:hypothetical protein